MLFNIHQKLYSNEEWYDKYIYIPNVMSIRSVLRPVARNIRTDRQIFSKICRSSLNGLKRINIEEKLHISKSTNIGKSVGLNSRTH